MRLTFTKQVSTLDRGRFEFFFARMETIRGPRYHVSVVGRNKELHHVTMLHEAERWRIMEAPLPPDWIMELEGQLSDAIVDNL